MQPAHVEQTVEMVESQQPNTQKANTAEQYAIQQPYDLSKPVEQWRPNEVYHYFLHLKKDEESCLCFIRHEITGSILLHMDLADLKEIGIISFGIRFEIIREIKKMLQTVASSSSYQNTRENTNMNFYDDGNSNPQDELDATINHFESLILGHQSTSTSRSHSLQSPVSMGTREFAFSSLDTQRTAALTPQQSMEKIMSPPPYTEPLDLSPISQHPSLGSHQASEKPSINSSQTSRDKNSIEIPNQRDSKTDSKTEFSVIGKLKKHNTSAFQRGLQKVNPSTASSTAAISGWMSKRGTKAPRFFCLHGTRISYFTSMEDEQEKGIIDITSHRIEVLGGKKFKVIPPSGHAVKGVLFTQPKIHVFQVSKEEELRLWVNAIRKATIERDEREPVRTTCVVPTITLAKARLKLQTATTVEDMNSPKE